METKTKILIVEDQAMISEALVALLGMQPDFEVVGTAASVKDACVQIQELKPDVLLTDFMLGDGTATEVLKLALREHLETKSVVMTALKDAYVVREVLKAGALGYVLKHQCMEDLIEAIVRVASGKQYLSPEVEWRCSEPSDKDLSAREVEVLQQITTGATSTEIAATLFLSVKTVETHRSNIFRKLGFRNTVDLMRWASAHGLVM